MERWGAKVIALFITFVSILITTLLPIKLYSVVTRFGSKGEHLIGCLMCFSGGVFLGAYMLHMAPEVRNLFDEALFHPNRITYPVADCVMVAGFFMMIFLEILVRYLNTSKKKSDKSLASNNVENGLNDIDSVDELDEFEDEPVSKQKSSNINPSSRKRHASQEETLSQKLIHESNGESNTDKNENIRTQDRGINVSNTKSRALSKRLALFVDRKRHRLQKKCTCSDASGAKNSLGEIEMPNRNETQGGKLRSSETKLGNFPLKVSVPRGLGRVESDSTKEEGFDETCSQVTYSTLNNLTVSSGSTRLYDITIERANNKRQDDLQDVDSGCRMVEKRFYKNTGSETGQKEAEFLDVDVETANELTEIQAMLNQDVTKMTSEIFDVNGNSSSSGSTGTPVFPNTAEMILIKSPAVRETLNSVNYDSYIQSNCEEAIEFDFDQSSSELLRYIESDTPDDSVFHFNFSSVSSARVNSAGTTSPMSPISPGVASTDSKDLILLTPNGRKNTKSATSFKTRTKSKKVTIDSTIRKPSIFGFQLVNGVRIPLRSNDCQSEDLEKIDEELNRSSPSHPNGFIIVNSREEIAERKRIREQRKRSSCQLTVKETTACKEYKLIKYVGNKSKDRQCYSQKAPSARDGHRVQNDNQFGQHSQDPRSLTLLLALSLHNVFEGLSVGLKHSVNSVWNMCIAVVAHEIIIAFGLGMQMVRTYSSLRRMVFCAVLCSSMVPLGVVIGLMITETGGLLKPSRTSLLTNGTLQGLATGVFIYVTFFEILRGEMGHGKSGMDKMFFMMFGFIVLALLALLPEDTPMILLHGGDGLHPSSNITK